MLEPEYKSKKDIIVEILRNSILSGEIEPGEKLLQAEIAEKLNVSPTPVREAIRQLEAEGVLEYITNKGVRVVEVKPEDMKEIYQIRAVLESLATRKAVPNLNKSDVEKLLYLQDEIDKIISSGELERLRISNHELHWTIYNKSGMRELNKIIRTLWTRFPWDTFHILPGRALISAYEHREIIDAIINEEAILAGEFMQKHVESAGTTLVEYLTTNQSDLTEK